MRQGEICALRWVDVDLSDRPLRVEHAASAEKALKQIVMGV
jgi:integrase